MADLEKSSSSFLSAWKCNNSIPFHRIQAAARAVNVLGRLENLEPAAQLAQDAINLLPTISNRSLQRSDNNMPFPISLDLLPRHVRSSSDSICLSRPWRFFEKGRTTILSQLIGDESTS